MEVRIHTISEVTDSAERQVPPYHVTARNIRCGTSSRPHAYLKPKLKDDLGRAIIAND